MTARYFSGNKTLKLSVKKTFPGASRSRKPVRVWILGQVNICDVGVLLLSSPTPPQQGAITAWGGLCSISCSSNTEYSLSRLSIHRCREEKGFFPKSLSTYMRPRWGGWLEKEEEQIRSQRIGRTRSRNSLWSPSAEDWFGIDLRFHP